MKTDKQLLIEVANQIELWAIESKKGGHSTHQVKSQTEWADKIYAHIHKHERPERYDW